MPFVPPPPPPQPQGNPVPPDPYERFVQELQAIRMAIDHTNTLIPQQSAETAKKLSDFYKEGLSEHASRGASHASTPSLPPPPPGDTRRATGAAARDSSATPSRPPVEPGDTNEVDANPPAGAPSKLRWRDAKDWASHAPEDLANQSALTIPRSEGGHYTAADLFKWGDKTFTTMAQKRQADGKEGALTEGLGRAGFRMGRAAELAPQLGMFHQYLSRSNVMVSPSALEAQGASMGVSPAGNDVSIGPIGFRMPFLNDAAQAGMAREFQIQKMRMGAGINGDQTRFIFDQLNARGFKPQSDFQSQGQKMSWGMGQSFVQTSNQAGSPDAMRATPSFDEMSKGLAHITKNHPELANEETVTLMDKATRYGTTSVKDFTSAIADVSRVAQDAGVSFQQLQQDMDAVGEANQKQGGTHFQGQKTAIDWTMLTKLPATMLPGLLDNPLVQAQGVRRHGLMPWEQGLENGAQRVGDVTGAVSQVYGALGNLPSIHENLGDGFSRDVSSRDRKLALLHTRFPEMPREQLEQMTDPQKMKTIMARAGLLDKAQGWSQKVGRTKNSGAQMALFGHGAGNYGALRHQMTLAGFSKKEKAEVDKAGDASQYTPGNYIGSHSKKNEEMMKYLGKHKGVTEAQYLATQRFNKVHDILKSKDNKVDNQPHISIGFDEKAKKMGAFFNVNKQRAQAGTVNVNLPYAGGASPSPSGDPGSAPMDPSGANGP